MDSNQPSKIGLKGLIPLAELLRRNRNRKLRHLALGLLGGMASNGRKTMILIEMKQAPQQLRNADPKSRQDTRRAGFPVAYASMA